MARRERVEGQNYQPFGRLIDLDRDIRALFTEKLDRTKLHYHDFGHTFGVNGVVASAYRLAYAEQLPQEKSEILIGAATVHDLGLVLDPTYKGHEVRGAEWVKSNLERYGFDARELGDLSRLVIATNPILVPQSNDEMLIRDADVANLGSYEFWDSNYQLMREFGVPDTPENRFRWQEQTLQFLRAHKFHTETARRLWDDGKEDNIRSILERGL